VYGADYCRLHLSSIVLARVVVVGVAVIAVVVIVLLSRVLFRLRAPLTHALSSQMLMAMVAVAFYIKTTLLMFTASLMFAYLVAPLVAFAERRLRFLPMRGHARLVALLLIYVLLFASAVASVYTVGMIVAEQVCSLR